LLPTYYPPTKHTTTTAPPLPLPLPLPPHSPNNNLPGLDTERETLARVRRRRQLEPYSIYLLPLITDTDNSPPQTTLSSQPPSLSHSPSLFLQLFSSHRYLSTFHFLLLFLFLCPSLSSSPSFGLPTHLPVTECPLPFLGQADL
ncbi:hypothetical protein BO99DRAFT_485471, partial [Aspergillus violaceofuscus CBS 115571]